MIKKWYLKIVRKPTAATMDEWADWTEATKKNHPILYAICDRLPLFFSVKKRRFRDFIYHLKQKYSGNGYHILKLDVKRFKEPYNLEKLHKYSWMDSDSQIDLFMFQILVNFIEKEVGLDQFKEIAYDEESEYTGQTYKKLLDLYYWFIDDYCDSSYAKKLREELHTQFPDHKVLGRADIFSKPKNQRERDYQQAQSVMYGRINDHDEKLEKEMTQKLIELVKLRGSMWT